MDPEKNSIRILRPSLAHPAQDLYGGGEVPLIELLTGLSQLLLEVIPLPVYAILPEQYLTVAGILV